MIHTVRGAGYVLKPAAELGAAAGRCARGWSPTMLAAARRGRRLVIARGHHGRAAPVPDRHGWTATCARPAALPAARRAAPRAGRRAGGRPSPATAARARPTRWSPRLDRRPGRSVPPIYDPGRRRPGRSLPRRVRPALTARAGRRPAAQRRPRRARAATGCVAVTPRPDGVVHRHRAAAERQSQETIDRLRHDRARGRRGDACSLAGLAGAFVVAPRAAPAGAGGRHRRAGSPTAAGPRRGRRWPSGCPTPTPTRTEVGQVGAALNRMLGHVGDALAARQASETRVRQFVADASHELRTPLAAIRGYAELTRRGEPPAGHRRTRWAGSSRRPSG